MASINGDWDWIADIVGTAGKATESVYHDYTQEQIADINADSAATLASMRTQYTPSAGGTSGISKSNLSSYALPVGVGVAALALIFLLSRRK
jgi:hypothetical protein